MAEGKGAELRKKVFERRGLVVPGAANALAARVVESLGFEAIYLSGPGLSNTAYALPDLGFIGLADLVQQTMAIRAAVALPIIVDADTGFGNAVNVHHAVRALEAAGGQTRFSSKISRCRRSAATSPESRWFRPGKWLARSGRRSMPVAAATFL